MLSQRARLKTIGKGGESSQHSTLWSQYVPESVVIQFSERKGQETNAGKSGSRFGENWLENSLAHFVGEGTFSPIRIVRGDYEEIGGTGFQASYGVVRDVHGQGGNRRTIAS